MGPLVSADLAELVRGFGVCGLPEGGCECPRCTIVHHQLTTHWPIMREETGLPYEAHWVSCETNDQLSPEFVAASCLCSDHIPPSHVKAHCNPP